MTTNKNSEKTKQKLDSKLEISKSIKTGNKKTNSVGFDNSFAFLPYVCCGDPSAEFTIKLVTTLVKNGADAIELGIPFSDPIADGKTIQAASNRSLVNGMTPKKAMRVAVQIRKDGIKVPIFIMTYYNIVYSNGLEQFVSEIKKSGANGLIVPDLPIDESEELEKECKKQKIALVRFITPNTPVERLKKIIKKAEEFADIEANFIYAVSVLGTTGTRNKIAPEAIELIKKVKKMTSVPVVAGFGISTPEQAKEFADVGANGIIVGSRIVELYSDGMENRRDEAKLLENVARFTRRVTNLYKCPKSK
jgi:tryptophan synthase alpha chain